VFFPKAHDFVIISRNRIGQVIGAIRVPNPTKAVGGWFKSFLQSTTKKLPAARDIEDPTVSQLAQEHFSFPSL